MKYTKVSFPNQEVCCEIHVENLKPFMAWTEDLSILSDDKIGNVDKKTFIEYLSKIGYSIEDRPYKNGLFVYWLVRNSAQHVGAQEF